MILLNDSLFCLLQEAGYPSNPNNWITFNVPGKDHALFKDGSIQSTLDRYYSDNGIFKKNIKSVEICFVNDEFVLKADGSIESLKRYAPGILYFHKEFFSCPVSYCHITDRILAEVRKLPEDSEIQLWFHLRGNFLFVAGCEGNKLMTLNVFEVHKTLDVFYYMLFNIRNIYPDERAVSEVMISGSLLLINEMDDFLMENFPGIGIATPGDYPGNVRKLTGQRDFKYYPEISYNNYENY